MTYRTDTDTILRVAGIALAALTLLMAQLLSTR